MKQMAGKYDEAMRNTIYVGQVRSYYRNCIIHYKTKIVSLIKASELDIGKLTNED